MTKSLDTLVPSWLATFLSVARHRNYTRVAEELFLTQPAISRQMRALQDALGVRLIEQVGKTLELTDAGNHFLREAHQIRAAIERAWELVHDENGERGRLRLGASSTPGLYLLPNALASFTRTHPEVEVTFQIENTLRVEEALVHNEIDLGFLGGPVSSADVQVEPLVDDHIVVYASVRHPLARRRRVPPRMLERETFVLRERGSATRESFERWLATRGVFLTRTIELAGPEGIKTLVRAGVGLACSSCHGVRGERALRVIPVEDLDLARSVAVAWHRSKRLSTVHRAFLKIVRSLVRPC